MGALRPRVPAHADWAEDVAGILDQHRGRDVVLVGHGTAWTLLRAALLGAEPDLDRWSRLAMPDVAHYRVDVEPGEMLAP